jgi:hypothetical protein
MCDALATSREHAPPQCLFPELKDVGRDLRRGLITVPSCDAHNGAKSKDDEFMRAMILMTAAPTSEAAKNLFMGKLLRAVKRKPVAHQAFFEKKGTLGQGQGVLRIDRQRFDRCLDHLVRALAFDAFKIKWTLPIAVISPNFLSATGENSISLHAPTLEAVRISRELLGSEPIRGENPEVFKYRIRYDAAAQSLAFAAIFYDFFEAYAFSSPGLAAGTPAPG